LFRIGTEDGVRERLGEAPTTGKWGSIKISPDGRKVTFTSVDDFNGSNLWLLENFVPPESKR